MQLLTLELSAAKRLPVTLDALEVSIPGESGVLTVLPGHTPLLTGLGEGVVIAYEPTGDRQYFAVHRGFCEIADNRIMILADMMETRGELDEKRARAALQRAEEQLEQRDSGVDVARTEAAVARARARLDAFTHK